MNYVCQISVDKNKKMNIVVPVRLLALIRTTRPVGINLSFANVKEETETDEQDELTEKVSPGQFSTVVLADVLGDLQDGLVFLKNVQRKVIKGDVSLDDLRNLLYAVIATAESLTATASVILSK